MRLATIFAKYRENRHKHLTAQSSQLTFLARAVQASVLDFPLVRDDEKADWSRPIRILAL
jgi:hypothetical protein